MRVSRVRRLLGVVAALGVFAASAESREPEAEATSRASVVPSADLQRRTPNFTLFFFDVHHQLDGQFDTIAAETRAIFREMGAEVTWRQAGLGTTYGHGDTLEIPIIVLETPPKGVANGASVLGLVPRNAPGPRAVWIFVDNIRRVLGPSGFGWPSETTRGVGVAAARVIAHEVVHALAPELAHTKEGLMRHSLNRAALTERTRPAHDRCVTAVQAALGILPKDPVAVSTESALFLRSPIF